MIREEEAKNCKGCLDWHKYCKAECCKGFRVEIENDIELLKIIVAKKESFGMPRTGWLLTRDAEKYYKLRGLQVTKKHVVINPLEQRVTFEGKYMFVYSTCSALDGYMCTLHKNKKKPKVCSSFDETKKEHDSLFYVTPNCLSRYK